LLQRRHAPIHSHDGSPDNYAATRDDGSGS
jgi:hypothetical protein